MNNNRYNLIIVDMQTHFRNANNKTLIKSILNQIDLAKEKNCWIYILEYVNCGKTNNKILDKIKNYKKSKILNKIFDDGSWEIEQNLQEKLPFKICGVNIECCVGDTAVGLATRFPNLEVLILSKACRGDRRLKAIFPWIKNRGGKNVSVQ